MAVSTAPGRYTLAVIPEPSSSAARFRVWASSAALEAAYTVIPGPEAGVAAIPLEMLTILPTRPRSCRVSALS